MVGFDAQLAGRLVEQVDRLVGQEPVGDVAVGQAGGLDQRLVGDLHLVVRLVFVAQAVEDGDRLFDRGLGHEDGLKAPFERRVLLDVLAVLVEGGGAHALQLAAGEHGLHEVRGVDRALGGAGADHVVQLVDEQHDVFGALDFVERALEALLELAAVLGAGHHGAQVEGQHALAAQRLGHVAGDDLLGEAFGDGGLADAGLADERRVVLGAPAEHLDDALDLGVAADDRVETALGGESREVARVLFEHALAGGVALVVDAGVADLGQGALQALLGHAEVFEHGAARALALEEDAEQQVLGAHELVAQLLRLLHGDVDGRLGVGRHVEHVGRRRARRPRAGGLVLGELVGARHGGALVDAEQVEDLLDDAAGQAQHADQQVLGAQHVGRARGAPRPGRSRAPRAPARRTCLHPYRHPSSSSLAQIVGRRERRSLAAPGRRLCSGGACRRR